MTDILNQALIDELRLIMEDEFPSLVQTFLEESERQYRLVCEAHSADDMEGLRRSAHSLKGACANLGAERLQATCAELEQAAKNQQIEGIESMVTRVDADLSEVREQIVKL